MPFAFPHLVAGLIAVLVGYTSSVVLIIQAATAAGADAAQVSSWLWTLGIGMGVSCTGEWPMQLTPMPIPNVHSPADHWAAAAPAAGAACMIHTTQLF